MASKVQPTATKPAKKAALKAAPAKAAIVQAEAVAEQLVTRIIAVDDKPITEGLKKMTETVQNTATDAKAKATDFVANMRDKAGEATEKAKTMAADATEFTKGNIEAMVEAGKIVANGAQEIGKTNMDYAKANFAEMQVMVKDMTTVKTPTDFIKLQGEWMRKGFDTAVAQGSKNTEAMVKLANDMFQPISNRFAVAADMFKKAA